MNKYTKELNVLFIGNFTDETIFSELINIGILKLSQAAALYQKNFIKSLDFNKINLKVISIIPSNEIASKHGSFEYLHYKVDLVGYGNNYLKSIVTISNKLYSSIKLLGAHKTKVILYSVNPLVIIPLIILKKICKIELITICSEIPILRRYKRNIKNIIKYSILNYFNKKFEKYIIFSNNMKEYLPSNKKFLTIEGFSNGDILEKRYNENNIVMYAGGLAYDNGIHLIIDAANKSKLIDELWICGSGECEEYVRNNQSEKIKYMGRLPNSAVRELEREAKILLNIRNPKEKLTKYSFPSKIIEYLSSGAHVISTRLEGIPTEYYNYIQCLDGYNSTELAKSIDFILKKNKNEYLNISYKEQEFIRRKLPENYSEKIYSFLIS